MAKPKGPGKRMHGQLAVAFTREQFSEIEALAGLEHWGVLAPAVRELLDLGIAARNKRRKR